ncbi:fumarylacetoacetate hydrolase family protein [Aliiroseovarius subalbicans]|uniref:fumarylacetoacetate hydrolase family protein n=1 Tax=Aliiroseovarius subalbicans TaxID=2925840 RepID=UPI001F5956A0|nr:fumarylacetoacetate hydrolase family protein [Aliiroseovarius subalbicans]MCI2400502.1 fumarylacetoacetate hydrolase family protein [Aliiroseovarius subalbicans]
MKYMVGETSTGTAVFAINGEKAVNITALDPGIGSDLAVLAGQGDRIESLSDQLGAAPTVPVDSITPALPVANPGAIICVGLNYTDHIKEGGYDIPDYPALFMRSKASIMAAGKPMVRPTCSERLDYEAELMLIVGKGGRHISEADALDHVFGYTVFNDGSVRDYQRKTHQWTPGKNFDDTGAIGPIVVTPDEVPEGAAGLNIESRVGDEILQSSNTANMIWGVRKIIAIVSEYTTLAPGDLIALGTPPGVGHAKKPNPRWLVPGETVEIEIEGIGICASPIVDEKNHASEAAE